MITPKLASLLCACPPLLCSLSCWALEQNFVLIKNKPDTQKFSYHTKLRPAREEADLANQLRHVDASYHNAFVFYPMGNAVSSPTVVAVKKDQIFLYEGENRPQFLGTMLPLQHKDLEHMADSVAHGHILMGFRNKNKEPVAFVEDTEGALYAVSRQSRHHYAIQAFGTLSPTSTQKLASDSP